MAALFEFVGEFDVWCRAVENRGMVKNVDDFFANDAFQVAEIDHHPEFDIIPVLNGLADDRNRELVTVAVHVFALAVVSVKCVPGFETELLGDSDVGHFVLFGAKVREV